MAITTESGLTTAISAGQRVEFLKSTQTTKGASNNHSLWTTTGQPTSGAAPGSVNGIVPTSATVGAIPFVNPASGSSYLAWIHYTSSLMSFPTLYDRLWTNSGLSATAVTSQAITHPGLTRFTSGEYVELWVEIYTATTAAATATIIYTNQAGTGSKSTTVAIPASTVQSQMIPVPLAAGDYGVRSVQSVQLGSSMTAGNWGLTQVRDIASVPLQINTTYTYNAYDLGLPTIPDNACLAFLILAGSSTSGNIQGEMIIAQG